MGIEFRHLRYFVVLAEELHFGRAARRLSITQPPLSLNIQQLEAALGVRLFDRDSRSVGLTAAGRVYESSVRRILAAAEDAGTLARDVAAGATGRLRVGFVGSMLFRGLPQWLNRYAAEHPRVDITLSELNTREQIDALQQDRLDIGFVHTSRVTADLQTTLVHGEPFACCVPERHPLARLRTVPLGRLKDEPFVLFSQGASPDYHHRIVEICASHGFAPRVAYEARHWLSVVALVGQGLGISIVPKSLEKAGIAGAAFRPFREPAPPSEVHCVWSATAPNPARDAFRSLAVAARAA